MTLMETKVVLEDGTYCKGYSCNFDRKYYSWWYLPESGSTDQWCGACSASWEWLVSIAKENRLDYYNALETYEVRGELGEFADLVAEL